MQNPGFERQDNVFIRRLRKIIVDNFSNEQFDVEQLSSEIGLSRSQLYRRLKQINGLTISQFIRHVRLEEAKKLLISDTAPVFEIAYLVGFNSPAYFHTCFQEYFGLTPGEVKKIAAAKRLAADNDPAVSPQTDKAINPGHKGEAKRHKPPLKSNGFSQVFGNAKWLSLGLFMILTVVVVGFLAHFLEEEHKGYQILAILPMEYFPASLEQEYWVKAFEETFREELERIPNIQVLSKASTMGIMDRKMLLPEMAEELQVDAIIEGSVLTNGDSVWLRVNTIKTHPVEQQIWAGEFLELLENIKSGQETLVRHIAGEIKQGLGAVNQEN